MRLVTDKKTAIFSHNPFPPPTLTTLANAMTDLSASTDISSLQPDLFSLFLGDLTPFCPAYGPGCFPTSLTIFLKFLSPPHTLVRLFFETIFAHSEPT